MCPPSLEEIRRAVVVARSGTAAGLDLISIDILKLATDASLLCSREGYDRSTPPAATSCLRALAAFTSFALRNACNSDLAAKRCWTALILNDNHTHR